MRCQRHARAALIADVLVPVRGTRHEEFAGGSPRRIGCTGRCQSLPIVPLPRPRFHTRDVIGGMSYVVYASRPLTAVAGCRHLARPCGARNSRRKTPSVPSSKRSWSQARSCAARPKTRDSRRDRQLRRDPEHGSAVEPGPGQADEESGGVAGENNRANFYPVGAATINLRSLGSRFTTVVFNGRRFPEQFSVNTGRFNNITWIPNAAVGSVETLKAGGAATYGADAIAGVVNYVTRKGFEGLELNGDYRYIEDSRWRLRHRHAVGHESRRRRRAARLGELSASQRAERDRSRFGPAAHAGKPEQLAEPDVGHLEPRHGRIPAARCRRADVVHAHTGAGATCCT